MVQMSSKHNSIAHGKTNRSCKLYKDRRVGSKTKYALQLLCAFRKTEKKKNLIKEHIFWPESIVEQILSQIYNNFFMLQIDLDCFISLETAIELIPV